MACCSYGRWRSQTRIRARAQRGRRAVVVGLGFIGSEVAASLRQLGVEVTALAPDQAPLARVLGGEVGDVLGAIHREKGVDLVLGDSVAAFEGSGRVERVRATSGSTTASSSTSIAAPHCPMSTPPAT